MNRLPHAVTGRNTAPIHSRRLLTLAAFALAVAGCSKSAAPPAAPPPPEVGVAKVVSGKVRQWDDFIGRVSAVETVELRPRVSGYVERIAFAEGQDVKKGDLLFVIDQRRYRVELARSQAEVERARADAQLAQAQDARGKNLVEAKAISREEFDTRRAATTRSAAAVRAAEAAVAAAQLDLTYTEVRSPIDGRAGRALITVGNLAQADQTVLATLMSQDPMYVYFESDEQTYLRYNALARKGERTDGKNPVRIGLAGEEGYPHQGTIDFTNNQVDTSTGTIRARAVLPNPDRVLTPGLFARVQLEGSGDFDALMIDDKAVLTDQDRKYVYVVGPKSEALRKDIVPGRMINGLRVVESGLAADDQVIVQGVQRIFFPNMPIAPKPVAMNGNAPSPAVAAAGASAAK